MLFCSYFYALFSFTSFLLFLYHYRLKSYFSVYGSKLLLFLYVKINEIIISKAKNQSVE